MLWYGYIYYIISFFTIFIFTLFLLKLFYVNSINYKKIIKECFFLFFNFFLFFTTCVITILYYSIDVFSTFSYSTNVLYGEHDYQLFTYFDNAASQYLINLDYLNISLVSIYAFPFIYIFIFITILSLLFCLSYNVNELSVFSFYIMIILIAGYVLFFTDSIILFFFSYETLLIPSFFILYNFAKTRRCVEAAYLMFF